MSNPYITQAIKILATVLNCPEESLSATDSIETVDTWDSLNHMRLILHIEEVLGHEIETETALELFSATKIADLLESEKSPAFNSRA